MVPVSKLYDQAAQLNIPIVTFPIPHNRSMSVMEGEQCYIGMDESVLDGGTAERVHLGHELGHCATGSFYNIYAPLDLRQRHENRADKWAIGQLIPVDALDDAVAAGYTTLWDLAEYFGVTERFMRKAVCLYTHGNVAAELYF